MQNRNTFDIPYYNFDEPKEGTKKFQRLYTHLLYMVRIGEGFEEAEWIPNLEEKLEVWVEGMVREFEWLPVAVCVAACIQEHRKGVDVSPEVAAWAEGFDFIRPDRRAAIAADTLFPYMDRIAKALMRLNQEADV